MILHLTCFKSSVKNFIKFDLRDWKIFAFKIGFLLNTGIQFQMTLTAICRNILYIDFESKNFYVGILS